MYGWSEDVSSSLTETIGQAQSRVGVAGLFSLAILAGVGFLFWRAGRPEKRKSPWKY